MSNFFSNKFSSEKYNRDNSLTVKKLSVNNIHFNPNNPFKVDEVEELKVSILEDGLLDPINVYALKEVGQYRLLSGHRRLTAILELIDEGELDEDYEVKAFVEDEPNTNEEEFDRLVAYNGYRVKNDKDLKKLANIYLERYNNLEVKPKGNKRDWIASKIFVSGRHVSNLLKSSTDSTSETQENNEGSAQDRVDEIILETYKKLDKELNKALKTLQKIEKEGFPVNFQPINRSRGLIGKEYKDLQGN